MVLRSKIRKNSKNRILISPSSMILMDYNVGIEKYFQFDIYYNITILTVM